MKKQRSHADTAQTSALAADQRVLIGKLKRRLREHTPLGNLTWSQVAVLGHLEREGPATVTDLAKAQGMRSQSMGVIVSVLESAGLVVGVPDPNDGRKTILSITAVCRKLIKTFRAAREDWLFHSIQIHLSSKEQQELTHALALLERIANS